MLGLILAGGENSRYPAPKGLIMVEGARLIERSAALFRDVCGAVAISTRSPELYYYLGLPMIGDTVTGPSGEERMGPMAGIRSAFGALEADALFVSACDMPWIEPALARHMASLWDGGVDALVPVSASGPEPLLAIYGRSATAAMDAALARGERSMRGLLAALKARYVSAREAAELDPLGRSFVNINTPEDHARAFGQKADTVAG